jgi:hypothetical protein
MKPSLVLPSYVRWHYTDAIQNIWGIITNFIWFFFHFFSVPLLSKNLFEPFAPWHDGGIVSSVLGFVIRVAVILFAYSIIAVIFLAGIMFYAVWFLIPLILVVLFLTSIRLLSF